MPRERRLFIPFAKVNADTREVSGRLTQEIVDRDGEIWDYEKSVPHMREWSASFEKATDGKSLGNLRAMHQPISAGKLTAIDFNDSEKAVDITAKVVDDAEWEKVDQGVYTGFSLGGQVIKSWRDPSDTKHKRFEVRPHEASLADLPCVPTAVFTYVKLGGVEETRAFKKVAERLDASPKEGEDKYGDVAFADTKNKKYPIDTKAHVRAALSRWGQKKNRDKYSADDQKTIGARIRAAAKKFGIGEQGKGGKSDVTEKAMLNGDFSKGLYDVSRLAQLVEDLSWAQRNARFERDAEGDESTVPDQLLDNIEGLLGTLEDMLGEESHELLASLGRTDDDDDTTISEAVAMPDVTKIQSAEDYQKLAKKHFAKLADVHERMTAAHKMMGDACEKLAGLKDDLGTTTEAAEERDESKKIADAEYQKVTGERNDFEKRAIAAEAKVAELTTELTETTAERDELAQTGKELLQKVTDANDALTVRKGKLVAVEKVSDSGSKPNTEEEPKTPVDAFRKAINGAGIGKTAA